MPLPATRLLAATILLGLTLLAAPATASTVNGPGSGHPNRSTATTRAPAPRAPEETAELRRWTGAVAARTDVPARAAFAYAHAAARLAAEQPRCGLGWNTLAGIGRTESRHGTMGGRRLLADGRSSTAVVGPALTGTTYAAIRPTREFRRIHGDPSWDHAVGPMQFIGSTWARWAADGDGDGRRDPLDLDDAALAAGRYLCASGRPLVGTAWTDAVRSYNDDLFYVAHVFDATVEYAALG